MPALTPLRGCLTLNLKQVLVVIHLDSSKFLRLRRNMGFPSPTKVDLQGPTPTSAF